MAALAVMVALNFPFWLDGSVEPTILGLPIVFTYHLGFALLSAAVLWLLFTAIWPSGDEESDAGQGGRPR